MKLYDQTIEKVNNLLEQSAVRSLPVNGTDWPEVSDKSMILRSEMAFELGSNQNPGIGATIITANDDLVSGDGVFLHGKDLPELKRDAPYARVAIVKVDEATLGEGEALYKTIRDLEYVRYHYYPEGFMMRVSPSKQIESVRIGKAALSRGLNFEIAGNRLIEAFKKKTQVEAVQVHYVTDPNFDYKALSKLVSESEEITKTIDHILKNVIMDCGACSLQAVCDEVEGLKELHFKK